MILIVGHRGVMGRRYASILDYLGLSWTGVDIEWEKSGRPDDQYFSKRDLDGVIIASPTNSHIDHIEHFIPLEVPLLCEKPITKDTKALSRILSQCKHEDIKLDMVWQYKSLVTSQSKKTSRYDYFNHGKDGLFWDCIQIISLAKGDIQLGETSPFWDCAINGRKLHLDQMDGAYVNMIKAWTRNPKQNLSEIELAHLKVKEMIDEHENLNRHTGPLLL